MNARWLPGLTVTVAFPSAIGGRVMGISKGGSATCGAGPALAPLASLGTTWAKDAACRTSSRPARRVSAVAVPPEEELEVTCRTKLEGASKSLIRKSPARSARAVFAAAPAAEGSDTELPTTTRSVRTCAPAASGTR